MVRYRPRLKSINSLEQSAIPAHRVGRTYEDYLAYIKEHPQHAITEMDTVLGRKNEPGKTLLTLCHVKTDLLLIFLMLKNSQVEVVQQLDAIERVIGTDAFQTLFAVLLTDNGSEFKNPELIERSVLNPFRKRCRLFYCHPYSSWEKPHVEQSHRYICYILPKGSSFKKLTIEKVQLMASHINSYARESLKWKAPLTTKLPPSLSTLLTHSGIQRIPEEDVCLTPDLLKAL